MSSPSSDGLPPMRISRTRELSMPLALLISLLLVSSLGYSKWISTEERVTRNSTAITALEIEARSTREILIRIDENVKDLRRAGRRPADGP